MYRVQQLLVVTAQILLLCFAESTNGVYYLHEDGFAHAISIEKDPKNNLVMINKEVYDITFNMPSGFLQKSESFYRRLANKTIIVATKDYKPYVEIRRSSNKTELSGYIGDLWMAIERVLQFRTVIKRAGFHDGQRLLKLGAADVLLLPAVITDSNMGEDGFTRPVASSWYELYVRAPESKASPESHFRVWTPKLWIATLATIILLIVATRIMYRFGAFEENRTTDSDMDMLQHLLQKQDRPGSGSLGICFLSVLGSICSEGFQLQPRSASGRLLMVTTLLFSLLLYNSYSAVLMASLAVTNPALPFGNLEEVAKKGTHALCVRNESYAYMQLKVNESDKEVAPKWRGIVKRKPCGNVVDYRDLKPALCKWGVVVLEAPSNMGAVTENASLPCQMKKIHGQYFSVPVSVKVSAGFQYTSLINSYIHRLQASGILRYLHMKWTAHSPGTTEDEPEPNTTVTLRHVQLVLSLYAASIVCSCLILAIEIAWFKKQNDQRVTAGRNSKPFPVMKMK